jgi:DNA (cytosine-5)-methyltransferase 1
MRYLSVCSGIEAASCAWHALGWEPVAFSEIEPFPRSVLQHHYPAVPLHGDFTTIQGNEYGSIDLLVGGTPCQSFSVAGLRGGMDDERGNLALEYIKLAGRTGATWVVWENVPGVFSSSGGNDFRCFLSGLVGWDVPIPQGGWQNSGFINSAPGRYGVAWRVLDAQYFGVAQRRRRVFVVGCLGDWRSAAAVLFERHSLCGHPAPSRQAGQTITPTIRAGSANGGAGHGARSGDSSNAYWQRMLECERENGITPEMLSCGMTLPTAFSCKDSGGDAMEETAPTLRAMGHAGSHANGGGQVAVAFQTRIARNGRGQPSEIVPALVRRLTPRECERLQGFPDDHTRVPVGKPRAHQDDSYCIGVQDDAGVWRYFKPAADGPRYKALGNSMAVPVMHWIGKRIAAVDAIPKVGRGC